MANPISRDELSTLIGNEKTASRRRRNRGSLIAGIVVIVLLGGYSLLAAITNAHQEAYREQVGNCLLAVSKLNSVLPIVSASADGKVPLRPNAIELSALSESLESKCFEQKYLSALNGAYDRFVTVRDDALAAVQRPESTDILAQSATREAQFHATNELIAFLTVAITTVDSIEEPSLLSTAKDLVGLS